MTAWAGGYLIIGILWATGILVTVLECRLTRASATTFLLTLCSLLSVVGLSVWLFAQGAEAVFAGGEFRLDLFSLFVQAFVFLGALCALLLATPGRKDWFPGSSGLILLSVAGASALSMAWNLMAVVIGFVGALVPLWGLAALRSDGHGREGALKGMIMGSLAAALTGMGAALLLVRTGTTNFEGIRQYLLAADWIGSDPLLVIALALILAGTGCFVAAVPFHMHFVDVVESLSGPGALLMSGCILAAGLAAVARMLLVGFQPVIDSGPGYSSWMSVLHGVGIAALLVCNALALVQRKLKRMLAYLAAGQGGLVLLTLAATGHISSSDPVLAQKAMGGILVFLAVFTVNWVGLFVAVEAVGGVDGADPDIGRLQGLAREHPWLAVAVGLALLCMAGMPLTAGFFPRLYLLEAMVDAGWTKTAVVAALSLGLVLVTSLGLVAAMVMHRAREASSVKVSCRLSVVAVISSLAILLLGILPGGILYLAIRSATSLLSF